AALGAGPVDPRPAAPADPDGAGGPRAVRRPRRGARDRRLRGRSVPVVRPPGPAALLEIRAGRGRAGRVPDPVRGTGDARPPPGPVRSVPGRSDVPEPGPLDRHALSRERPR